MSHTEAFRFANVVAASALSASHNRRYFASRNGLLVTFSGEPILIRQAARMA